METYIGTKIITATPMVRGEYCRTRDWDLPLDENGDDEGYYLIYQDGYISWCPKPQFDEAYRKCNGMTFGLAIEAAKKGKRIARAGWNGKGMFVVYQKGYPDGIPCNKNTAEAFGYKEGDLFKCRPYLQMRCADGSHQMWLASQSDILEEDWQIIE